ncbi:hypothetical protein R1flu_012437 [Riccia fluitans]|uniref:Uncharacterized protein n=1 Tax=Riccia fluitans TaxID=41844 RepID=A0ABD1ZAL2_9MARC
MVRFNLIWLKSVVCFASYVTALNGLSREWISSNPSLSLNWAGDPCLNSCTGVSCDSIITSVIALAFVSSTDGRTTKPIKERPPVTGADLKMGGICNGKICKHSQCNFLCSGG